MNQMSRLIVEKENLIYNFKKVSEVADSPVIPVLKANGYGLGDIALAELFTELGVKLFAVARTDEAKGLCERFPDAELLLLSPCYYPERVKEIVACSITATVDSREAAQLLNTAAKEAGKQAKAHIKIDTGFGRFGFLPDETETIIETIHAAENIEFSGIYSHFSAAFAKTDKLVEIQHERFAGVLEGLKQAGIEIPFVHLANSSAALRFPDTHYSGCRCGSALIGRLAMENRWGLKKCGYLESDIDEIRTLPAGHNVGYGNTYKTKQETKIAVLQLGTTDGVFLSKIHDTFSLNSKLRNIAKDTLSYFSKKGNFATINGKNARIIGRLNTTNIILDVTDIDCIVGDPVRFEVNPLFVDSSVERVYR